jgi:hypothetical protein
VRAVVGGRGIRDALSDRLATLQEDIADRPLLPIIVCSVNNSGRVFQYTHVLHEARGWGRGQDVVGREHAARTMRPRHA